MTQRWLDFRIERWMLRRLALFLAILMSGGILLIPRVPVLLIVIVLCLHGTAWRLPFRRALWPVFALLGAVLLLTLVRPGGPDLASLATRYANFAAALLLLNMYASSAPGTLARDLQAVLWPMALQAILTVLLATFAGFLFMPLVIDGTLYQTVLLVFTHHSLIDGTVMLPRPDGFFFEPGVFQIYLNIYVLLAYFVIRKKRHVALGAAAVLATQSTTGIVILMLIFSYATLLTLRSASSGGKVAALAVALCIGIPLAGVALDNIEAKTVGDARGSSWAREFDLYTGLNVIAEHPLLGIGFDNRTYYQLSGRVGFEDTLLDDEARTDRGSSNGIITLFYSLGIPIGLVFVFGLFRQQFVPHRVLFGICMLLSLFAEALFFSPFFLMLAFSGLMTRPGLRVSRPAQTAGQQPVFLLAGADSRVRRSRPLRSDDASRRVDGGPDHP
jgi:hypothetical protein